MVQFYPSFSLRTGPDLSIRDKKLIHSDKVTGLLIPNPGAEMVLANGQTMDVPPEFFLHPQTGRVLPIQGNVAFDPMTSKLVFTVDSATGEATKSDDAPIPYVPYPVNPTTGVPADTKLKALDRRGDLKYGGAIPDPENGMQVPIMAVTIHPQTGAVLPVGGSHTDPITGLPVAIEVGSLMIDPISNLPVPILSVTLDPHTADVIPVGGSRKGQRGAMAIVPGDVFVEPMSSKPVKVGGAFLNEAEVLPSSGGYQSLLDSSVMACEARVLDAVRIYKEAVAGNACLLMLTENAHTILAATSLLLENSGNI